MSRPRLLREKSLVLPEVQNPFVHQLHFTWLDKLQIALMTVTVFPIRLLLILFFVLIAWGFASLALLGKRSEDAKEPLQGWRRRIKAVLSWFGKLLFFAMGFHGIKVTGKQATAAEAPILVVAPHSTFFDAVIGFYAGLPSAVSAIENLRIPFVGMLTRYTQPVFVSREDPNSRQNTIQEIKRRAQSRGKWPQVVIFPEGTCTNRNCLISFKPGAFYPGVPVQPVCLKYKNKLDTVTWTWEGPDAFHVLWYTLCQFNTKLEVEFLPVYTPSEAEMNDAKLYAANVRAVIAERLKVPISDHTYEDIRLMNYAAKLDLPSAVGAVEFAKLSRKLGMNYDNMKELLEKFCGIAQDQKGAVTIEEFASHLGLPVSDAMQEVFKMYDRDGSGTIDFREYVIGLSLISMPSSTEDIIKLAFKVFDEGDKGFILEIELADILGQAFGMEEVDVHALFERVDADHDGKITYDEFKLYAKEQPEYATLFCTYQELKARAEKQLAEQEEQEALIKRLANGDAHQTDGGSINTTEVVKGNTDTNKVKAE